MKHLTRVARIHTEHSARKMRPDGAHKSEMPKMDKPIYDEGAKGNKALVDSVESTSHYDGKKETFNMKSASNKRRGTP